MYETVNSKLRGRPAILFKNIIGLHDAGGAFADVTIYAGAYIGSSLTSLKDFTELDFYYDEFWHGRENFRIFLLVFLWNF